MKILGFMLIFSILVVSCADQTTGVADTSGTGDDDTSSIVTGYTVADYFPLQPNASWTYLFYDSSGNRLYDSAGNHASSTYLAGDIVAVQSGTNFYSMGFFESGLTTGQDGKFLGGPFIDSVSFTGLIDEQDSLVVYLTDWAVVVWEVGLVLTPTTEVTEPVFPIVDEVVFRPIEPLQPFTTYEYELDGRMELLFDRTWALLHGSGSFRTTAPTFTALGSEYMVGVDSHRVYQFYKTGTDFDLDNPDSCYIPLSAPLEEGATWQDSHFVYNILSISNDIVKVGRYLDTIGPVPETETWYAPHLGIIRLERGDVHMALIDHEF